MRGDLEATGVEDLAADVAVQAAQVHQAGPGEDPPGGLEGVTADEAEAELLVLVPGRDELMGVRLDPDRHPDHHRGDDAELLGDGGDPLDLGEGVEDDTAHAVAERLADLGEGLVVAVHRDPLPREAGPLRDGELATGRDVEAETLLVDPPGDGGAEEGLARVVDVGTAADRGEGRGELVSEGPGPGPEVVLVQDVCRGAVLAGQLDDVDPTDLEPAVVATRDGPGPQLWEQRHDVVGIGQVERGAAVALGVECAGLVDPHRWCPPVTSAPAPRRRAGRVRWRAPGRWRR